MLRITIQRTFDSVLLKLEGSIKGPWVDELRKAWLASTKMADGQQMSIELSAVSFVDARGRDLLLRMQRDGADSQRALGLPPARFRGSEPKLRTVSEKQELRKWPHTHRTEWN